MYARIVIYSSAQRNHASRRPDGPCRRSRRALAALALAGLTASLLAGIAPAAEAQWRFSASPAAAAWYAAVDSLRLAGHGPFPLVRSKGEPVSSLGRGIADERFEILHFVPLYFPSATSSALADAVDDAAGNATPRAPRSQFAVGAIRRALPDAADRRRLAELAALARRIAPPPLAPAQLAAWQAAWDSRFAAALAPFLAGQRLDRGVALVVPSLGAEGRVFAGVPADRSDNLIAVGVPLNAADIDGPLYAAVRELCFPLVSRVAESTPAFRRAAGAGREAARRASLAAVRCGADLLDRVRPSEAAGYRRHWSTALGGPPSAFDQLYPPDTLLSPRLRAALQRFAAPP
ncbi:MAG: hypothetical protein HYV19_03565 [Gemmatimonadetes bacterium]|nr:hypothetical protein [Gemmatimonadota bacterium]